MGKASRRRTANRQSAGETRPRERQSPAAPFVARPFEGLTGETDWVALREVVPAATATVRFATSVANGTTTATVATVLPMAWAGLHRTDGEVMVGLQTSAGSGDASRDVAQALLAAAGMEPGQPVTALPAATADTPRLQDLLDRDAPFEVSVHAGFDFWVPDVAGLDAEGRASLEQANASAVPTTALASVTSGYWCAIGERTHIRWVLPHDEDDATDALARLHAADASSLGPGSRLLGAFRAGGLLVPVWDVDPQRSAADHEQPMAELDGRLREALAVSEPLTPGQRRARAGLLSRQVTLR